MSSDHRISRRDFFKLLGAGGYILSFWLVCWGSMEKFNFIKEQWYCGGTASISICSEFWKLATCAKYTSTVAIHTALTPNGKIFYLAGFGWDFTKENGPYQVDY